VTRKPSGKLEVEIKMMTSLSLQAGIQETYTHFKFLIRHSPSGLPTDVNIA